MTDNLFATQTGWDDQWIFVGSTITPGSHSDLIRTFEAGKTYAIIADGDPNAGDIDLYVLNSKGQVIRSDTRASKKAFLVFRPSRTGTYTVRLKLTSAYQEAVCFVAFLKQNGGLRVPMSDTISVWQKMLGFSILMKVLGHTPRLVRIYGKIMKPGDEARITVTGLSARLLAAVALGDDYADDIDLYVHRSGQLLNHDVAYDATPICIFPGSLAATALTVKYISGTRPSFIFLGIYE